MKKLLLFACLLTAISWQVKGSSGLVTFAKIARISTTIAKQL